MSKNYNIKNSDTGKIILITFIALSIFLICTHKTLGLLSDNLVNYYSFDENNPNVWDNYTDVISYNNFTQNSPLSNADGKILRSVATSGTTGFYGLSYYTQSFTTPFSINMWVISYANQTNTLYCSLLSTAPYQFCIILNDASTYGNIYLLSGTNSGTGLDLCDTNYATDINVWNMITTVWKSNSEIEVFINGSSIKNCSISFSQSVTPIKTSIFGYLYDLSSTATSNSGVDELGVWNKILSYQEIIDLYNDGDGLPYPFNQTIPIISEINSCGYYSLNDNNITVNITNVNETPCLRLNLNNVKMACLNNITGSGTEIFSTIEYMNNSIIQDCNINNFLQMFLIPENTFIGVGENNIFRNINMYQMSSAGFGFDIRTGYNQALNHTEISDINIYNSVDNYAVSMYGDGIEDIFIHDINIYNSYSGMFFGLTKELFIDNYYFDSGTIYGLYLYGTNNANIENTEIKNIPWCTINVDYAYDTLFLNVVNDINDVALFSVKYCSGEGTSSINPSSSYNTGWFPRDYTQNYFTSINDLSLYNLTNSYDVISDVLVRNHTKSYFIYPNCLTNWIKQSTACINGVRLIEYKDSNTCDSTANIPLSNNTNEECTTKIEFTGSTDLYVILIFALFFITFFILALKVLPQFFIVDGLLILILGFYYFLSYHNLWIFIGSIFTGVLICLVGIFFPGKE
jgi:hypothetical protein